MLKFIPFLFFILFSLSSCIEIVDDLSLKSDGSGTFKYTVNLSSSKIKVNSILALDSIDGKRVPNIDEIRQKIEQFVKTLDAQYGISNVKVEENYTDFIFKFQCDFTSVLTLQDGLKQSIFILSKEKSIPQLDHNWLSWDGNKLVRSIPEITGKKINEINNSDIELLKKGSYTSITRFDKTIDKFENQAAQLSKSKMAVMVKTDTYRLKENQDILENTIYLGLSKN
ncbi:MAG: hypothetical protein FJZ67_00640 [Bacteroidetes bacterium]|nr:hypothetical protein [Bacteroidota bacterium]